MFDKLLLGLLTLFSFSMTCHALDYQDPYYEHGEKAHTISFQKANFEINKIEQSVLLNSDYVFEEEAESGYGFEYLFHFDNYHAIGAQYFAFTYNYVSRFSGNPGELDVAMLLFTYKAHTRLTSWWRPFFNLSVGLAAGETSSNSIGSMAGFPYGAGLGFYFPFSKHIGLTTEYRYLGGTLFDSNDAEIDIESEALIGAINIIF